MKVGSMKPISGFGAYYGKFKSCLVCLFVLLVFSLTSFSCGRNTEISGQLPNIIFILVDDMRRDQLGINGHAFAQTPNIDRIGQEGVIFTNAFVCTPLCSPSSASFLSGQYPHKHRIINNDRNGLSFISHKLVNFPQLLRRAGYETAFIGKWYMGDDDTSHDHTTAKKNKRTA